MKRMHSRKGIWKEATQNALIRQKMYYLVDSVVCWMQDLHLQFSESDLTQTVQFNSAFTVYALQNIRCIFGSCLFSRKSESINLLYPRNAPLCLKLGKPYSNLLAQKGIRCSRTYTLMSLIQIKWLYLVNKSLGAEKTQNSFKTSSQLFVITYRVFQQSMIYVRYVQASFQYLSFNSFWPSLSSVPIHSKDLD